MENSVIDRPGSVHSSCNRGSSFHQNIEEGVERRFPDWSFTFHKTFQGTSDLYPGWFTDTKPAILFCRIRTLASPLRVDVFLVLADVSALAVHAAPNHVRWR